MADSQLASLEAFLKDHPAIKYTIPSSPDYWSDRKVWNLSRPDKPLAIVRSQSADDVGKLVKFCKSKNIKFTIRVGGHNLEGRAIVDGALTIDLRALTSVKIAADRQSATIGGGILQQELASKLWEEGLATPTGSIPSVGYVGWATYGGYGPFSAHWGLGVDQIIGVTVVNADGDIIQADESALKGIRGAGAIFGVIVDLTIKVYPMNSLLAGAIMYESQDIHKAVVDFNDAYRKLQAEGLPRPLTIQQIIFNTPGGRMFGAIFTWSGSDMEEGQRWNERIASLGTVAMTTVSATNIPDWFTRNGALVAPGVFGACRTLNLRSITSKAADVIGKCLEKMPSGVGPMLSIHELRDSSVGAHGDSVFASREPHFMFECLGFAAEEENREASESWAVQLANDIQEAEAHNVLPTAYISLYGTKEASLSTFFGPRAQEVVQLKERYDPDNVFSLTVPQVK